MKTKEQETIFNRWIRDHAGILHHAAHGFAEGADCQDLMQEMLMAVWKSVPAFRGESSPATFLYRVCHHTALTWQRGRRNYSRRLLAWQTEQSVHATPPSASPGPDGDSTRLAQLYKAIRELPELDRSLVLLSLDGLSHRAIGGIHGLTESHVGVRLHRARHRLSQTLNAAPKGIRHVHS